MKFFYGDYEGNEEKYKQDCEKAIKMLREVGFNEEILKERIEISKRDYGEEFFWTVVNCPQDLKEWAKDYDLSKKNIARDFVLYCLDLA